MDGSGSGVMQVNASQLSLAAPRRKDLVKVISGAEKGQVGKVQVKVAVTLFYSVSLNLLLLVMIL